MKKALWIALFLSTVSSLHANDFRMPEDRNGQFPTSLSQVGVRVHTVRYSLLASTVPGTLIAVHGVLTSTKVTGSEFLSSFVELRASNTANTASELLYPPLEFSSTTRNTLYRFNPPLLAPEGLSVNITTAAGIASVFYTLLSTNTKDDYTIPTDIGGLLSSPEFYGVKVASNVTAGSAADLLGTEGMDFTSDKRLVATVPSLFYGIGIGTATNTGGYVVAFDSAGLAGANTLFMPPIFYSTFNYEDLLSGFRAKQITFPWPLATENGLVLNNSVSNVRLRVFTKPRKSLR